MAEINPKRPSAFFQNGRCHGQSQQPTLPGCSQNLEALSQNLKAVRDTWVQSGAMPIMRSMNTASGRVKCQRFSVTIASEGQDPRRLGFDFNVCVIGGNLIDWP
ncbi:MULTISPECIES: hypothetical protein [Cupriavidus]